MTVSIGKKGKFVDYMSSDQIKQLSDEGNVIGSHTYDHKNFKKYEGKDWEEQLDKPTKRLEEITGKKSTILLIHLVCGTHKAFLSLKNVVSKWLLLWPTNATLMSHFTPFVVLLPAVTGVQKHYTTAL